MRRNSTEPSESPHFSPFCTQAMEAYLMEQVTKLASKLKLELKERLEK